MKKIIFILLVNAIFNLHAYDLFTPKINHGTLEKLEINTISSVLGISEEEVYEHPPQDRDFGTINNYNTYDVLKIRSMIPQGFFSQEIEGWNLTFFRIIYEVDLKNRNDIDEMTTYQRIYIQNDVTKEIYLTYEDYMNYEIMGQLSIPRIQKGVMLIIRNGQYDGLMIYRLWEEYHYRMEYDDDEPGEALFPDSVNNKHEAFVFFFGEGEKKIIPGARTPDISIEASTPLLDWNDLFKYTIQNAFDQNPATSYVEDTEDDLMEVEFNWHENFLYIPTISLQRKMINGYAKNSSLYMANNRIKEISIYNEKTYKLSDETSQYQLIPQNTGGGFKVISVYSGNKYSDTCLAELDLLIDSKLWLFGGYYD